MLRDLVLYVPLAVWCNTAAGPLFDPVLLWYAGRHAWPGAWLFVGLGAAAAALGAALEAGLVGKGALLLASPPPPAGPRFYVMAFLVALSPAPFTLVRAASLRRPPRPLPYALAVAAGRLPRYAATVAAWQAARSGLAPVIERLWG